MSNTTTSTQTSTPAVPVSNMPIGHSSSSEYSETNQLHLHVAALLPELTGYFLRRLRQRDDAADAAADTLVALLARSTKVPRDPVALRQYAYGVARNVLAATRRGRALHHELAERISMEILADPQFTLATDHIDPDLDEALAKLPAKERELLLLVAWEGFGVAQAGAILGWKPEAARKRYSRVRARLRTALG